MHCHVYASRRKPDTYVWLPARDAFDALPEELARLLGELRLVLEVQLDSERKLPHEDSAQVLAHLRDQGWHLQLPPGKSMPTASETHERDRA